MVSLTVDETQVLHCLFMLESIPRKEVDRNFSDLGEEKVSQILKRLVALEFVDGDETLAVTSAGAGYFLNQGEATEAVAALIL